MRYIQMNIRLKTVKSSEKEVFFRLLQYSLFEESLYDQNTMTKDALFDYPWFDLYFMEEEQNAYFITDQETDRLLGFVMINTYMQKSRDGHSIAEFMILPAFRRNHIGKEAALQCFEMYPGRWEVSPSFGSRQAYLFWDNVISSFTCGNYRYEDGIFIFGNPLSEAMEQQHPPLLSGCAGAGGVYKNLYKLFCLVSVSLHIITL